MMDKSNYLKITDYFELPNMKKELWNFYKYTNEREILTEEILSILKPKANHTLIDIGCGEGDLINKVKDKLYKCVGLDPDVERLRIIRARINKAKNVRLVPCRFEDFFTDEKFDFVVSCHTLSFFKDKEEIVNKMISLTKENGRLVLILHSKNSEQLKLLRYINNRICKRKTNMINSEKLYAYLKNKGFNVRDKFIKTEAEFPSIKEVLRLSYFFFRINYSNLSEGQKRSLAELLENKLEKKKYIISTIHGIITLDI